MRTLLLTMLLCAPSAVLPAAEPLNAVIAVEAFQSPGADPGTIQNWFARLAGNR